MIYRNQEHYPDPTAGKAIGNVMRGNRVRKDIRRLLQRVARLERKVRPLYDFSKLTTAELRDIVNDNLSEDQFIELLESIRN
jgi:hypothetical protein